MMSCMTFKLQHVVCEWRSQILRKKILHAFAMDENEYAFLCTVTAVWLSKSLKISLKKKFNGIYETMPFKYYATLWCRAWRISYNMSLHIAKPNFEKKILHAFAMDENERAFLCTVTVFWLSKITEISSFHLLMVFTKPCHLNIMQRRDVMHDV